jgi:hypothetical protein
MAHACCEFSHFQIFVSKVKKIDALAPTSTARHEYFFGYQVKSFVKQNGLIKGGIHSFFI